MSTRSNIAIKRKNGKVKAIYCHWDGYLSYNGDMLLHHYRENGFIPTEHMNIIKVGKKCQCKILKN